jgi:hypothetical protein
MTFANRYHGTISIAATFFACGTNNTVGNAPDAPSAGGGLRLGTGGNGGGSAEAGGLAGISGGGAGAGGGAGVTSSTDTNPATGGNLGRDAGLVKDVGRDWRLPMDSGVCTHEFSDPGCWSGFEVSGIHPNGTLLGGIYDGKHVFFPAGGHASLSGWYSGTKTGVGQMLSYDPKGDFTSASSWTVFTTSAASPAASAFAGAVFDGRYIYYPPYNPAAESVALRYDTQAPFDQASAWTSADLNTFNKAFSPVGYVGGAFDGRYVYFVPNCFYEYWSGLLLRYDTQAPFADKTSWSLFDTQTLSYDAGGYIGAAFDGRYLYFPPWGDLSTNSSHSDAVPITRFDTQASFTAPDSWTLFDSLKIAPTSGFGGAVFDGRYVYFLPGDYQRGDVLLRYDTKGIFTAATSWTGFALTPVTHRITRFVGGVFDGRYLYLVPTATGAVAVRYDTSADFSATTSWEAFDVNGWDERAQGFGGGVFDGKHVYFVPLFGTMLYRFDAYPSPVKQDKLPPSFL